MTIDIIAKTREDYNRIAKYFSDTRRSTWPEFERFKKMLKPGQNILDWGCGNGRLFLMLRDYDIKYFGVDISIELLKIARKIFRSQVKTGQAKFFSNAKRLKKFPKNYFDLVFCIASFFHLPDEKTRLEQLQQFYHEMKPGGKIIMLLWNLGSDWAKIKSKKWKKLGKNDFLIPWKTPSGELVAERYYHHFVPKEIEDLLARAGFKKIKIKFVDRIGKSDSRGGRNMIVVAEK